MALNGRRVRAVAQVSSAVPRRRWLRRHCEHVQSWERGLLILQQGRGKGDITPKDKGN